MSNSLLPFMKAVGIGKNSAKNLDRQSACEAMSALLAGQFHPVTFGAFFMAMRYKGETGDELAGFLDALSSTIMRTKVSAPAGLLSCAGAYDGKARTCNVSIPAALVAVAAGVPVAMHGAVGVPTKFGMTNAHVLEAVGVDTTRSLAAVSEDLHTIGIGYISQPRFHSGLSALLPMRSEMGKRTILNTMETLSNPFGAESHLGGFFHDAYAELICQALLADCTTFRRATLVKGIEGSDELRPGTMHIARVVDGSSSTEVVNSDELGLPAHISDLAAPTESLEQRVTFSAQKILDLLDSPRQESGFRNSIILNAGIRLYATGKSASMQEAVSIASEVLNSGAAKEVLSLWKGRRN